MKAKNCIVIFFAFFHSPAFTQSWDWVRMSTYGLGGGNSAQGLYVDANGDNYTTGYFAGKSIWGTDTLVSTLDFGYTQDVFILKQNSAGKVIWVRKASSIGDNSGQAIATDTHGNIYITGTFQNTLSFGNISISGESDYSDIFIAKYSTDGNIIWAQGINGPSVDVVRDICIDNNGYIYITGYFTKSIHFGSSDSLTTNSYNSLFIAKYDSLGNFIWARNPSGPGATYAYSITSDSTGAVYVSGCYSNYTIFDTIILPIAGKQDILMAKFDSSGKVIWAKNAGGTQYELSSCIRSDKKDYIYVTGYVSGTTYFDGIPIITPSNVDNDMYLAKYTLTGALVWVTSLGSVGGNSIDNGRNISVKSSSEIYVTIDYSGTTLSTPNKNFNNLGSKDLAILKYDDSGNLLWGATASGNNHDECSGVDTDGDGNLYIAGYCWGGTDSSNYITIGDTTISFQPDKSFIAKLGKSLTTGIHEFQSLPDIFVFPNPASSIINVSVPYQSEIIILDIEGKIIKNISSAENLTTIIDLSYLTAGMYFIKINTENQWTVRKIIKQ